MSSAQERIVTIVAVAAMIAVALIGWELLERHHRQVRASERAYLENKLDNTAGQLDDLCDIFSQFRADEVARDHLMFRRHGMRWPWNAGEPTPSEALDDGLPDVAH